MTTPDKKKLIAINLALWIFAMLLNPLVKILHSGAGEPPKIFEVLVPIFFFLLAGASSYLLSAAIGKAKDE